MRRVIVWFRQDLRLHDNEALVEALKNADEILPVYVFDERVFRGTSKYGFPKTGIYRASYILEAVKDLRVSLRERGNDLIVRSGKPEEEIFQLAHQIKSNWVFCNRERTREEIDVQDALERNLWSIGQEIRYSRGKMLYYTQDLPFPITHAPDSFVQFRKEVERFIPVRKPLETPDRVPPVKGPDIEPGEIPTLITFGHGKQSGIRSREIKGGETAALANLQDFFYESGRLAKYRDLKQQLPGKKLRSHFSAALAQGCVSPKRIYREIHLRQKTKEDDEATRILFLDLLQRDFLRIMGKKHGNRIFKKNGLGLHSSNFPFREEEHIFQPWCDGQTGVPVIDACMRQLNQTGYLNGRGRQLVATFLVSDLEQNWQMGADYFESLLIDYDPCSNWGNWAQIAGVGADVKAERNFNVYAQSRRLDPQGEYIRKWLPELDQIPSSAIHCPAALGETELMKYGVVLGEHYPEPILGMLPSY